MHPSDSTPVIHQEETDAEFTPQGDQGSETRAKGDLFGADQRVYDSVFSAVLGNRINPGAKLTEATLCKTLGLPRAVVRMGLLRLAHDRIVELRPNRGAVIASPSLDEARHIYAARRMIEGAAVESLWQKLTRRQLNQLRSLVRQGAQAFEQGAFPGWIELAGEFHIRLAQCTGNPILAQLVRELVTRSQLITALYLNPGRTIYRTEPRLELLDLLEDGDPESAKKARSNMENLIQSVEHRLGTVTRANPSHLSDVTERARSRSTAAP